MSEPKEQGIIRRATRDDRHRIIDFIRPYVESRYLLPRTLDEVEELIDTFFVAELDGVMVGCATLEIYGRKLAEIRSLAVAPEARGYGIGKRLVEACIELARERDVFEVMAISSNERFFIACGFDFTLPQERKAFFLQTRDEL